MTTDQGEIEGNIHHDIKIMATEYVCHNVRGYVKIPDVTLCVKMLQYDQLNVTNGRCRFTTSSTLEKRLSEPAV